MANEVRVKGIVSWTYPYFGNNHVMSYGVLLVTDGVDEKSCRTKGDRWDDGCDGPQYITFKRKRYQVVREGMSFAEKFRLEPMWPTVCRVSPGERDPVAHRMGITNKETSHE